MLNLQRYSNGGATTGWMATGGDMINTTSSQYTANLIYMSGSKGVFSVSGGDYDPSNPNTSGFVVYQHIKSDGSKQIWLNVNDVNIPMNGFQTKDIWNNQANPDVSINGNGLTGGIKANQVHNFNGSPLTGKDAPYYGISTQRASQQIWIPHRTPLEVTGSHTNTIKYVDETGKEIFPESTSSLNLKRNIILDITQDQIKKIQDYALNHTADETLNYIKNAQAVSSDSGWKYTDANGNTVTDPYATVKSPTLDGYTATIQSTNVQGLKAGEDGSSVTAKFAINPSEDIVQNGELSDSYKNNGVTGIPDNYVTVVVYKKAAEKGSVKVVYHDDTTNTTIDGYGYDSEEQDAGTKVDYKTQPSIDELTSKGYVYVTTDGTIPAEIEGNQNVVVTVHMKHGVQPVTPDTPTPDVPKNTPADAQPDQLTKKVNLTVNYVNADGTQFTGTVPANAKQTATFTGTAYVDKITGKLVNAKQEDGKWVIDTDNTATPQITWTSDKTSFDKVVSPVEQNYHLISVSDHQDSNDVAAITGLTKDSGNITVTVTYAPNGKIIPVDPSGNPIPDAPTPQYPTNPTDPSKVTPNEPVPNVPGYTPSVPTVTPTDPGKDTPVPYTKPAPEDQTIDSKQTVHYIDGDTNTALREDSTNGTFTFVKSGQTGQWNADSHKFENVDAPVINGYVAERRTYEGQTSTPTDPNKEITIIYHKVGKIIPVGPDGKTPIPDAPTPSYPNDPTDPTKVTPNEPVPNVPGWTTDVPNVTPEVPTKDTNVPYTKPTPTPEDQTVTVKYIDDTTGDGHTDLSSYDKSITAKPGEALNYTTQGSIAKLKNKGYKLVSDNFNVTTMPQNGGNYEVHFIHNTTTITPDKPGNPDKPINPNDPDGPKWPSGTDAKSLTKQGSQTVHYVYADGTKAADDNVQNTTFDHTLVFDNVTGKKIEDKGWTPDNHQFSNVTSPVINGYTADKTTVPGATVTVDNPTSETTVTYTKNGNHIENKQEVKASQIVNYVDDQGNTVSQSKSQNFTFTYTGDTVDDVTKQVISYGKWLVNDHDFTAENVPVIDGYVAVSGYTNNDGKYTAGGFTTTHGASDKQRNRVFTVVYKKVGKIIPVGPDGKTPISDAPTPSYPNDPTDPTKVTPNEPVPTIPGYTPSIPTVTPGVPTEDTPVPYTPVSPAKDQQALVNYVDADENNRVITTSGNLSGKAGERIDYSTATTIQDLENKGYVLVNDGFPAGATYDNDDGTVQTYTVVLRHGTQPVTPTDPGKPGEPINPYDPDGPKYPDGSDQVTKNVTRTIQYVDENGDKISASVEQPVNFTAEGVLDKVTGQWTTPLTWSIDQTVSAVKSPVIGGYHLVNVDRDAAGNDVASVTLTHENDSYTVTVKYAKNGKIVPVDPTGKPIPDVPQPQYPTDPTDPAKVTPNEPVPTIPGYTPEVPTVTPDKPGEDTPVVYHQNVQATVNYIDDVTGQTLKTDTLQGVEGNKSDYSTKGSIANYESQGYKLVSDDFPADGYTFATGEHIFNVHLTHSTSPVNPDHPGAGYSATDLKKTVTRTINYLDGQGNTVHNSVSQSFDFIANGTVDNVTHKLVTVEDGKITGDGQLTWNAASHDFDAVVSPTIKGMYVTNVTPTDQKAGDNVAKTTVNNQSGNIIVNVYYASNGTHQDGAKTIPSTQTVTFVDEDGNELHAPAVSDFTFSRTPDVTDAEGKTTEGSWNATSHTYGTVNVPVIPGYVAEVTTAGGKTATIDNPNVTDKVVYKKVGKIIPVDPTGKPIPDTPTPNYPNDPTDPTKVTPDEPVPSIPGYTPDTPTVTPDKPTTDTPVTYRQNVQATVTYIDDVTGSTLKTDTLTGLDGKPSDYSTKGSIANYESQGYKLVSDDFPAVGYTFSTTGTHSFTVHLTHGTEPVNPEHPGAGYDKTDLQKEVTRTIHFVNTQNGKQVADPVSETVNFTANGTVDKVTGKLVTIENGKITGPGKLNWTPAQDVKAVESPAINDMHITYVSRDADGTNVKGVSLTHNDSSYDVYVNYAPNGTVNEHGQNIPASQTIKFVDENGNTLRENNVQTSEFTRTPDVVDAVTGKTITEGAWNETSHKFGTINVPVIDGYVAEVTTAGGLTATTDNPNVVTEVVYKKVGKIIPVDPTGNPIPNVPTPSYPNDPADPTKVTPNEPVPTIPGYTPEVPTVTPEVPTNDTPVVYHPVDNTQNAQVRYIDLTNNEELANSGNLSGQPGDKINYSTADEIKSLEDKGYVLVNDGFPTDAAFDNDKDHDQVFTVTFRHGTQPVTPTNPGKPGEPINPNDPDGPKYPDGSDQVTKNITRTIQYVDENGNKVSESVEQTVNFTAQGVLDKVTGQWTTPLTWSGSQSVAGVKTPVVEGYHVVNVDRDGNGNNVAGVTLTHENDSYTVTVKYAKNGKIIPVDPSGKPIPNVPTPQYPTDPTDPAKVTPEEPVPNVPGYTPSVPTVTPTDPGKDTPVPYTPIVNDQTAVVNYVDQDNNNAQIATSGNLTGKPGSVINYSTADQIKQLEDQGYVLVSDGFPAGAVFDDDDNTTQTYTVVLKHGQQPVTPTNPGKPGEPINPNDPDGPKYPAGSDQVTKDVTRTIQYVDENGNKVSEPVEQTAHFTGEGVLDKVTGQWITPITWTGDGSLPGEKTPVVEGYHVVRVSRDSTDNINVDGTTVNHETNDYTVTVSYAKNGKIVPVDPSGKPIPNVPTPQYPTDPTDPSKVTPDEPVPTIPGYTPSVPTVTPTDPGKDTPVPYTPIVNDQTAVVNYVDQDNNNAQIATSGNLTGKPGSVINYSTADQIKQLEDQGYVLVSDGFPAGAVFDDDDNTTQTYTVVLKHGQQPVTPTNPGKPGEPINPNDPDGPKYPAGSDQVTKDVTRTIQYVDENGNKVSEPVEQTAHFTGEGVLDKVTGQWITPITWTGDGSLPGEKTPVVEGYHVVRVSRDSTDNINVDGTTVNHETNDYTVTVSYAKNGKIVPVDPSGKPIPNVPTPQYPTDPTDPSKVTPDEPVPTIPGYTPSVPTVTPTDPGKDTPVPYTPIVNDQTAVVNYVDQDNNNVQIATSGNLTGKPGSVINYSTADQIKQLEAQGYVLVSDGFPAGAVFDNDDNTTQTYTVVLKHGTTTFKPDKPGTPGEPINPNYPNGPKVTNEDVDYLKNVKFTVHYVGAGNDNPADNVQNAQWTRSITVDNVTGKIISSTEWVSNKRSYDGVKTPVVNGYHADRAQVDGPSVTMEDQEATVTYVPNGKIIPVDPNGNPIPDVPTPQYPTDPTDPTKVTPDEPVPTIPGYKPEVPTVTPTDPGVDTPVKYTPDTVNPKPAVDQIAIVNYVDQDNNNAQIATSGDLTGKAGDKINYSTADQIKQLEAQGYVLVTDGFPAGATFDDNADQNQVFTVVLKHGHAPVGPNNPHEPGTPVNPNDPNGPKWPAKDTYTKEYTSTVHFVDNNGNKMRDDDVQTSTWTRTLIIDKVTGQIINPDEGWTADKGSYNEVKVPVINGYVADKANVPAKETVQQNLEDTVTYTKIGNIVPVDPNGNPIPNVPAVPYTNDPTDPTKVVPNEPVPSVPGMTPNVTTVTPTHPTVDTPVVYTTPTPVTPETPVTPQPDEPATPETPATPAPATPAQPATPQAPAAPQAKTESAAPAKQEAKKLPQTGNENNSAAALGLAALGLTGLLAAGKKRRKED
ncbi:mucin-binding protein [Limosilactobacillus reuteri]